MFSCSAGTRYRGGVISLDGVNKLYPDPITTLAAVKAVLARPFQTSPRRSPCLLSASSRGLQISPVSKWEMYKYSSQGHAVS